MIEFYLILAMSYPYFSKHKSVDVYPSIFYPYIPFSPNSLKQATLFQQEVEPWASDTTLAEEQLSPDGLPTLYGAESMGVFLNLPEVLNLSSSSSCSDGEDIMKNRVRKHKSVRKRDRHDKDTSKELGQDEKFPKILKKKRKGKQNNSTGQPTEQIVVRKRGRPRKYPIATSETPTAKSLNECAKKVRNKNSELVIPKKKKNTILQYEILPSDGDSLKLHTQKLLQGNAHAIDDKNSFMDPKDKILIGWTTVEISSNNAFSLQLNYRIRLADSDSYYYPSRVTHELINFTDPVGAGYNGWVACSNKSILSIPSTGKQYTLSELQHIPVTFHAISITSQLHFDTNALYRVRLSLHAPELSGWFSATEVCNNSLFIHLSTQQPTYARVDSNKKCLAKTTNSPLREFVVDKIEKMYCTWKKEDTQLNYQFNTDAVYQVSMLSKNTRISYLCKKVGNETLSLCVSNRNSIGEIICCEKNRINHRSLDSSLDALSSLQISKMETMYSHWTRVYGNETYSRNSIYRANVGDNDGQLKYVLLTTMSPCELSLSAELYGSLPTIQQKLIKEITSPQSPTKFARTTYCYIERLNFIWNEVDIADKHQEFSLWKLYRVLPFNHTNLTPSRSILCTVVTADTLQFPDPYNKSNIAVVSTSSKNIYESTPRGPTSSSLSVSYPLTAVHELSTSWSILQLHYQTDFDVGYLYMAQINVHSQLLSVLSLFVTPDLLLFDSPNEGLSIGKVYSKDKSHVMYSDMYTTREKDRHQLFSVVSLRSLTGVIDTN